MKALLLAALAAAIALPCGAQTPAPTEVEIAGPLKGTLLKPAGVARPPVVVILAGSGPTDRDGNSPLGVKGATYRLLAEGLAAEGVASLRVDKRGMFASAAAATEPNKVFVDQLAVDALAWADKARAETGAPCAWLAGHSEGALVALVAGQSGKGVCGLILLSGTGRPLGTVLREQLQANPANAPLLPPALAAIADLEAGRQVNTANMPPPLLPLFHPMVQDFLINAMAKDPAKLIAAYKDPVLILQGSTDLQVTVEDAELLKSAQPAATLTILDGVNHLLKDAPAERAGNLATYGNPALPLDARVAPAVAGFIKAHPGTN
ncbi:MAG: alpha/beta hydrolase [Caulobacter sp.]|jgi:pimeloyl-ACP methyl ester carboxylesterase|nr:alpha/beta hydrolase [Caulobacter sp.]